MTTRHTGMLPAGRCIRAILVPSPNSATAAVDRKCEPAQARLGTTISRPSVLQVGPHLRPAPGDGSTKAAISRVSKKIYAATAPAMWWGRKISALRRLEMTVASVEMGTPTLSTIGRRRDQTVARAPDLVVQRARPSKLAMALPAKHRLSSAVHFRLSHARAFVRDRGRRLRHRMQDIPKAYPPKLNAARTAIGTHSVWDTRTVGPTTADSASYTDLN